METLLNAFVGIPIGIISGLYSGLIVARYQRFADLRSKVVQIIREIDFIDEGSHIGFGNRKDVPELFSVASDFIFLKHQEAGEATLRLIAEIKDDMMQASHGGLDYASFEVRYSVWQDAARSLSPAKSQLFRLWSGL